MFPGKLFRTVMKGRRLVHPMWNRHVNAVRRSTRTIEAETSAEIEESVAPFLAGIDFASEEPRQARHSGNQAFRCFDGRQTRPGRGFTVAV
jgi:hypothetical protein